MYQKSLVSGVLALTLMCSSAMAQTDAPPPGASNSSTGMAAPPAPQHTGAGRAHAKNHALISSCRSKAVAEGLTGHAKRHAVLSCVRAQDAQLAAKMVCRRKGKLTGLHSHTAQMRAYVKACLYKAH